MSAQGSAPRATLDLKVRVWGMGANGQPFFQNAMAQNISSTGACIYGVEPELKVGDVIGVQYEAKKARCKVIWVVNAGALKKNQVGVQLVPEQECPWAVALPKDMKVDERTGSQHDNRRKFLRHVNSENYARNGRAGSGAQAGGDNGFQSIIPLIHSGGTIDIQ